MGRKAEGWKLRWNGKGSVHATVRFRHNGVRHEPGIGRHALPSGERNYESARKAAALAYADIIAGRTRVGVSQGPTAPMPLKESIALWVAEVEPGYDPETIKTWQIYGRKWLNFFGAWVRVHDAGIHAYAFARLKQVMRKTLLKELSALRNFLSWAKDVKHWLDAVPAFPEIPKKATGVRSGKQRAKPVKVTEEQIERFIEQCPEWSARKPKFAVRAYFETFYETGLRPATLDALSVPEHYEKGRAILTITDEIDKARFGRDLPLTKRARAALDRVCPKKGLIFGKRYRIKQFKLAADAAKMPTGFAPYDIRHGRATHLLESSNNLLGVGYLLGHKLTTTTDNYTHKGRRHADQVIDGVALGGISGGRIRKKAASASMIKQKNQGDRRGSNPRQLEPQSSALPN